MTDGLIGRRGFLTNGMVGVAAPVLLAAGGGWSAAFGQTGATFRPEDFGARGDGRSDDTDAFQKLGLAVSQRGGGTIVLRRGATYRLGRQHPTPGARTGVVASETMLSISGVQGLTIVGNGATLKLNDGLRYGGFDPATGAAFAATGKNATDMRYGAAIGDLIAIEHARDVVIRDLILDGNMAGLDVGGTWGGTGIQLHGSGISLKVVRGVHLANVVSRSNGLDGFYVKGLTTVAAGDGQDDLLFENCRGEGNGRQGMSIVGGSGVTVRGCTFADTGQGKVSSAPSAGIDIEPNGHDWTTDLTFDDCTFVNNRGVGIAAAQGNSHTIHIRDCTFWQGFAANAATRGSGDAFWMTKDGVVVSGCKVHGSVTNLQPSAVVSDTTFDNDVHPTFGRAAATRAYLLANASGTFEHCSVTVRGAVKQGLVYSVHSGAFRDCQFLFAATGHAPNSPIAVLGTGVTLSNVTFGEMLPPGDRNHYIVYGKPVLQGSVVVTGPHVRWGGLGGPTGQINPAER